MARLERTLSDALKQLADLKAAWRDNLVKQIGAIALAALGIIGTVIGTRPTLPAPEIKAVRSTFEIRLDECRVLPPGSQEHHDCYERIYAQTQHSAGRSR